MMSSRSKTLRARKMPTIEEAQSPQESSNKHKIKAAQTGTTKSLFKRLASVVHKKAKFKEESDSSFLSESLSGMSDEHLSFRPINQADLMKMSCSARSNGSESDRSHGKDKKIDESMTLTPL